MFTSHAYLMPSDDDDDEEEEEEEEKEELLEVVYTWNDCLLSRETSAGRVYINRISLRPIFMITLTAFLAIFRMPFGRGSNKELFFNWAIEYIRIGNRDVWVLLT